MQQLRTTTGQSVSVSYDPRSNTVTFSETDWFAEPLRATGVPVKSHIQRPLGALVVDLASRRRRDPRRAA